MSLPERIQIILKEKNLSQRQFALSVFLTPSYISKLLQGGTKMSPSTALLIETVHGYAKEWLLEGTGPKEAGGGGELSPLQRRLIAEISRMPADDLDFMDVFIEALQRKRRRQSGGDAGPEQDAGDQAGI